MPAMIAKVVSNFDSLNSLWRDAAQAPRKYGNSCTVELLDAASIYTSKPYAIKVIALTRKAARQACQASRLLRSSRRMPGLYLVE